MRKIICYLMPVFTLVLCAGLIYFVFFEAEGIVCMRIDSPLEVGQ